MTTFSSPWNCIYSAVKLAQDQHFPKRNIMGSGPFRFTEHVAGSHWIGTKFPAYYRQGLPYLDGFKIVYLKSAAIPAALVGRRIEAEFRGRSPAERDYIIAAMGEQATASEVPWVTSLLIIFNAKRAPFDKLQVRRALSMAIDRRAAAAGLQKISSLKYVGGVMRPGHALATEQAELERVPGFGSNGERDKQNARSLLDEAGSSGLKFTLLNRNVAEPYTPAGIFIISEWKKIGVEVDHRQLDVRVLQAALSKGEFDVAIEFISDYIDDPTQQMQKYLSPAKSPVGYSGHSDTVLDDLYDQQMRELDFIRRKKLVRRFEQHALDAAYCVPLLWWQRIVVLNARVRGWKNNPTHYVNQDLANIWLENE